MQIKYVIALDDTYGKDISGNVVDMLVGTMHFISNADLEFYLARPDKFEVSDDINIVSYSQDINGVVNGFILPNGQVQLFSQGGGGGGSNTSEQDIIALQNTVISLAATNQAQDITIASLLAVNTAQSASISALQSNFTNLNENQVAETSLNKKFTSILQSQLATLWAAYNQTPAAVISTVTNATANEGDALVHTVTLSASTGGTFAFSITNNATSGDDYTLPPTFSNGVTLAAGVLTVPNSVGSFTVTINTVEDIAVESNESYTLIIGGIAATGSIVNDDSAPNMTVVSVSSPTAAEGANLVFNITLSGATQQVQLFPFTIGGTAIAGTDYATPISYSNGVTIVGSNISVPIGVSNFAATTLTNSDVLLEADEILILTIGGQTGVGTITNIVSAGLSALTDIAIFEAPYGMLSAGQKTATVSSGGYTAFAVSRNGAETTSYAVYASSTENGTYTKVLDNQSYTPSGLMVGTITYDHRSIAVVDEKDFPSSIIANTIGLIADSVGQQEHCVLNSLNSYTIGNETSKILDNVGVACFDSVPIQVLQEETARIYVLTSYAIDATIKANNNTTFYKVVPKNSTGVELSLSSITPISHTIISRASKPYPPRGIAFSSYLDGGAVPDVGYFPGFTLAANTLYIGAKVSSKVDETTPSSFFNPSGLNESGVVYKVEVEGLGGSPTPVRTLTINNANGYIEYGEALRPLDIERFSTKYTVYAEKAGIRSKEFTYDLAQDVRQNNYVASIATAQNASTINATVTLDATFTFNGTETAGILINLGGSLLPNVNLGALSVNLPSEILNVTGSGQYILVQVPRNTTNFVFSIPFTGGVGLTLQVSAGSDEWFQSSSIVIT